MEHNRDPGERTSGISTHLQSRSCLRCFASSCCSSSCTAAAAASPSLSTRRAARSSRQSAPAPPLPYCPPPAPEQASSSCDRQTEIYQMTNCRSKMVVQYILLMKKMSYDLEKNFFLLHSSSLPLLPTIALPCDLLPQASPPKIAMYFISLILHIILHLPFPGIWRPFFWKPKIPHFLHLHDRVHLWTNLPAMGKTVRLVNYLKSFSTIQATSLTRLDQHQVVIACI